jgi:hypothetical protein
MSYRSEIGIGTNARIVTPSDTNSVGTPRYLWVGTGGDLNVTPQDQDTSIIHRNVPSGSVFLGAIKRVNSTNTTASNIVAWE